MKFTSNDLNKTLWVHPDDIEKNRQWWIVDAKWKTLWRLAVEVAKKLIGKHKAYYSDFWDTWDFVVVINAEKIKVTWNKLKDKIYYFHSGYKWHLKEISLGQMLAKNPQKVIWLAVRKMLPKNKLRDRRMKRLKIFVGPNHTFNHLSLQQLNIND